MQQRTFKHNLVEWLLFGISLEVSLCLLAGGILGEGVPCRAAILVYCVLNFVWAILNPAFYICREGGLLFSAAHSLLPLELLLSVVVFRQIPLLAWIEIPLFVRVVLWFDDICEKRESLLLVRKTNAYRKKVHALFRDAKVRFAVLAAALLLCIPSIGGFAVYRDYGTADSMDTVDGNSFPEYVDRENLDLSFLAELQESEWKDRNTDQRLESLTKLAMYECQKLGVSGKNISLEVRELEGRVLGYYNEKNSCIVLQEQHIQKENVSEVMQTVIHEVYHLFQHRVVQQIDWDDPAVNNAYYDTARRWKENLENYVDSSESIIGYLVQPLEESARAYAEEELERLKMIDPAFV